MRAALAILAGIIVVVVAFGYDADAVISPDVVTVTTASDGTATAYSGRTFRGRIVAIRYSKTDFANGVDFTITTEGSGQTIWTQSDVNASVTKYPGTTMHTTAGADATHNGTHVIVTPVAVINERIKIQVAQGGDTKTGTFQLVVDGLN